VERRPPPAAGTRLAAKLRITNPPDGATFMIDPTLRSSYQSLQLLATEEGVRWQVNGRRVGREWPLSPGRHSIVASDARGDRDSVEIWVK
jgi:hypothetical protein